MNRVRSQNFLTVRKYEEEPEMKNTITAMQNTLEGINSRSIIGRNRSASWKTDIQAEQKKEKKNRNEVSLKDL